MPRTARIVIPGAPHHITHRGNNRQAVFLSEPDYWHYTRLILKYSRAESMRILGYCLMPNHIHIVAIPSTAHTFERVFRETQRRYSSYFNSKHARAGHLWQNRYYSCPMDEQHTLNALAYVELNPVRAGLVRAAERCLWSSAPAHCTPDCPDPLLNLERWFGYWTPEDWKEKLAEIAEDRGFSEHFRRCTRKGVPLGSAEFRLKVHQHLRASTTGPSHEVELRRTVPVTRRDRPERQGPSTRTRDRNPIRHYTERSLPRVRDRPRKLNCGGRSRTPGRPPPQPIP